MYRVNEKVLRRLMIKQKMNASDLARAAGVQTLTVTKFLRGGAVALLATIGKLADALGIDGETLISED